MSGNLSIEYFNCHGFNGCKPFLWYLMQMRRFMLTRVNNIKTRLSCAKLLSPCLFGIRSFSGWRLFGCFVRSALRRCWFLWKRAIDEYVTIIDCDYDRLCCIKVSNNSKDFYLLNVYMPYECEDNRDVYNDYMSKIVAFCNGINSTCIFIVGDFS